METQHITWHKCLESTNSDAKMHIDGYDNLSVSAALSQEKGRGQADHKWFATPGKNLTFTIILKPRGFAATDALFLTRITTLSLLSYLSAKGIEARIKWPNDIYWHDSKISGTIIDTAISGKVICQCIYGIGININQRVFTGDAPNPVSLCTIVGHDVGRDGVMEKFLHRLENRMDALEKHRYDDVTAEYVGSLYRRSGFFEYEDCCGRFSAEIVGVMPNGHLVLCDSDGKRRDYELKEVKFII